jgi:phosphopantetheinyl transferase (holo-ACP synthase)
LPVGNDVVDLRDPANQPDAIHPRFDRRVFARIERRALAAAPASTRHVERWKCWAAKESAFKLIRQIHVEAPFHPRELVVTDVTATAARISAPPLGRDLSVTFDVDGDRVHAVATDPIGRRRADGSKDDASAAEIRSGLRQWSGGPGMETPEREVRRCAAEALAEWLVLEAASIRIEPAGPRDRRPLARSGDLVLPADVSLSHDGRWLAWALLLTG